MTRPDIPEYRRRAEAIRWSGKSEDRERGKDLFELCDYIELLEEIARAAKVLHFYATDYDDARLVDEAQVLDLIAALAKLPPLPEKP